MPDLKSELSKVIDAWSEPPVPEVKKSITHKAWEYLAKHPNSSAAACANGISVSRALTTTALLALVKRGLATRMTVGGILVYSAFGESYPVWDAARRKEVLGSSAAQARAAKLAVAKASKRAVKQAVKRAAASRKHLVPAHEAAVLAPVRPAEWNAAAFVDGLTLRQARDVYDELHKVFGS